MIVDAVELAEYRIRSGVEGDAARRAVISTLVDLERVASKCKGALHRRKIDARNAMWIGCVPHSAHAVSSRRNRTFVPCAVALGVIHAATIAGAYVCCIE